LNESLPQPVVRSVSLWELFTGFLMIGLQGFGGIAVSAHHIIVERRRWLAPKEFVELFGICSILPGGNFMNATIMIGARYQGAIGSCVAMSALLFMPLTILISIALLYDHYSYLPDVRAATAGAGARAAANDCTGCLGGGGCLWSPLAKAPAAAASRRRASYGE
jgi:chromate transporter